MMIFTSDMTPTALIQNNGKPMSFTCDQCGDVEEGTIIDPGKGRESWAILPDDWSEVEDRREHAKKAFVICCPKSDCRHEAEKNSG